MKMSIARLALILAPLVCLGQARRIAIYDFDPLPVRAEAISVYGDAKKVGGLVASRIMSKLLDAQGFEVIDRQQIDEIMREQNLKFSDRFDPREAPKIGRILHVDAIIVGSVDTLAASVKNNRMGFGKLGIGGMESTAEATVSMRVISTESARVFIAESVQTKGSHTLSKGASYAGKAGTDQGTTSDAHPEALAATAALQKAADELAAKIVSKADSLPTRGGTTQAAPLPNSSKKAEASEPIGESARSNNEKAAAPAVPATETRLKIGRIDGSKIYIIGGENAGVKMNDTFEVRRVTGSMKDDSGGVIETDEKVDTIVVTEVQDKYAVARSTSTPSMAKVGDKLKPVKTPARRTTSSRPAAASNGNAGLPSPVQRHQ